MKNEIEKKAAPGRGEVEVLGATYEDGKPAGEQMGKWRLKLATREEKLKYLQNGERYFYGKNWFGSEKSGKTRPKPESGARTKGRMIWQ